MPGPRNNNQSSESQWNFHLWNRLMSGMQQAEPERTPAPGLPESVHSDGTPKMGKTQKIGAQQFDGDKIAWMAFLNEYAQKMGGWAFGQDRQVTEQMNNASRIDRSRREAYRRYIYAGGTMSYNDYLRESGLHSTYGGY